MADEGVPVDAMESPQTLEAFRQRRGTPVPWDVERRNEESVQRSKRAASDTSPAGATGVPDTVREVISSQGRSLDPSIQRAMEERMGDSFGDVRVHTGPTAAQACESIDARAFTVGNHVAFNQGEYDPESPEGQHVLAHELAHVRQQTQGAVSMLPQEDAELEIDPDPALEREAEEAAQQAMAGGPVTVNRMGAEMHVQRFGGSSVSSQIAAERGETGYKSDPRATGTVASNHHYRHSPDDSIDTKQLRRKLDGEQSIEEAIDQLLEEEGEELPSDVRERLESLSNEAHDLSLEGLASSIGIGITTAVLGTLLSHWILLSVPFTTFVYLLKNTEGSLEQRLRQVQSFVQEETGSTRFD